MRLLPLPSALTLASSLFLGAAILCRAQAPAPVAVAPDNAWSLHAQSTYILQGDANFPADYSGPNSLSPQAQSQHTVSVTAFIGRSLWKGGSLYLDPEMTAGEGLSLSQGIAGFPNGEATHSVSNTPSFNIARLYLEQVIGLGGETETIDDDQNQVGVVEDVNRLTVTVGKQSASDFFDNNKYTHDARSQFMNWALVDDAAWDFPADTKGYTMGATAEYNRKDWALRYGIFMEPREANGKDLSHDVGTFHGQVLEWEDRLVVNAHPATLRLLAYWNRADMGVYQVAAEEPQPDITTTRSPHSKVGVGLNWEQELTDTVGLFSRLGWNDGRTESWAYTEVDRTATGGLSIAGKAWSRPDDTLAFAVDINGLSAEHRDYLARGGVGFIVGDGRLNYGTEDIGETYYSLALWKHLWIGPDLQYVVDPGYNRDRGPVFIYGVRAHVAF